MTATVPSQPAGPSQASERVADVVAHPPVPVMWTEAQILSLDWIRLLDITRALAAYTGYEPEAAVIDRDGGAQFSMREAREQKHGHVVVIRLAPWNRWIAASACVSAFADTVRGQERTHAIYLAPAGASRGALEASQEGGVQLLHASTLAGRLNDLPRQYRDYFHARTFSGNSSIPTCPVCLRLMTRSEETAPTLVDADDLPDRRYHTHDIIGETVLARRIEVLPQGEVYFLREVHAKDMVSDGTVEGDFLCDGSLELRSGGVLTGTVAARSIKVHPGGVLHGRTRILKGKPEPIVQSVTPWVWRCQQETPNAGCEGIMFLPH